MDAKGHSTIHSPSQQSNNKIFNESSVIAEMINKTSYNQIADQWAAVRNESFVSDLIIDFAQKIKTPGNVLDVGCGTALPNAKYLSEQGLHVTGIDASEEMIRLAKAHNIINADFYACDFFDFNPHKQFDGIIAWDSLFHFAKDQQALIYPKIFSMLKPGAHFLFTHGKLDNEHKDMMFGHPFYYSSLSKERLLDMLIRLGFQLEYSHEDFREKGSHRELVVLVKRIR